MTFEACVCSNCGEIGAFAEPCASAGCFRTGYRFVPTEHVGSAPPGSSERLVGQLIGNYIVVKHLGPSALGVVMFEHDPVPAQSSWATSYPVDFALLVTPEAPTVPATCVLCQRTDTLSSTVTRPVISR